MTIWIQQFIRYAVVGLFANAGLFLLYLWITHLGLGHKTAMTALYLVGVLITFVFNRNWSFDDSGRPSVALVRYIVSYLSGFLINMFVLLYFVDRQGLPHQWIQGSMIFLLAIYLFLLQKFWVFRKVSSQ